MCDENRDQRHIKHFRRRIKQDWPTPGVMDSWIFLVTEVAEVGDALLRAGYGENQHYVRNNEKQPNLEMELGDVYLMLCTLANHLHIDLSEALDRTLDKVSNTINEKESWK